MVGEIVNEDVVAHQAHLAGMESHLKNQDKVSEEKVLIFTHKSFSISYNEDRVCDFCELFCMLDYPCEFDDGESRCFEGG